MSDEAVNLESACGVALKEWDAQVSGLLEGRTAVYLLGELSVDTAGTFLGSDTRRAVATNISGLCF